MPSRDVPPPSRDATGPMTEEKGKCRPAAGPRSIEESVSQDCGNFRVEHTTLRGPAPYTVSTAFAVREQGIGFGGQNVAENFASVKGCRVDHRRRRQQNLIDADPPQRLYRGA